MYTIEISTTEVVIVAIIGIALLIRLAIDLIGIAKDQINDYRERRRYQSSNFGPSPLEEAFRVWYNDYRERRLSNF